MNNFALIQILIIVVGFAIVVVFLKKQNERKSGDNNDQQIILLQNQIQEINRGLSERLERQFNESAKIIREVVQELTRVGEGQKQVYDLAKQLDSLRNILKNPKQRGVFGEFFLRSVLENVLPPGVFQLQYCLGKDEAGKDLIVDAAIFVKDKIIPVDSKFSLENYNRLIESGDEAEQKELEKSLRTDLKNRIDETSKYIRPDKGTMDFAFMFIPSEAVYYDLLINKVGSIAARDLIEYGFIDKKVIVVSPTSFLAYLQTVLQGLKALEIEESAKEIKKRVEELGRHIANYDVYMKKLGSSLSASVNAYNSAYKELAKIDKDVLKIGGGLNNSNPIEPEYLEQVKKEE